MQRGSMPDHPSTRHVREEGPRSSKVERHVYVAVEPNVVVVKLTSPFVGEKRGPQSITEELT